MLGTKEHPSVAGDDVMQIGQWRLAADGATFSVSHIDGQAQFVETRFSAVESLLHGGIGFETRRGDLVVFLEIGWLSFWLFFFRTLALFDKPYVRPTPCMGTGY